MLLSLTTTHQPATDLGYLLHKHPGRFQSFEMTFGQAHVFYPEANEEGCTACLLLDVDPVGMVRGRGEAEGLLAQYVNDRPYVASSFLSVAMAQLFRPALKGECRERPELGEAALPLSATLEAVAVRGGERFLRAVFEPLGYAVEARRHPLDERFPEWGESQYFTVTITREAPLAELLRHLYVLVPVFDNQKHYYIDHAEVEKLLERGKGWLSSHPAREEITRRYLGARPSLYRQALARLVEEEELAQVENAAEPEAEVRAADRLELALEQPQSLNEQRHGAVIAALRATDARRVLDLGCAEGRLLRELQKDRRFEELVGLDVSARSLEIAERRLRLDRASTEQSERVRLLHGSLTYRDRRLEGFDAAAVVEVIEHLDPPRLQAFERVLFEFARPRAVVLTTPNREYNIRWDALAGDQLRHADHRFEWTRAEFQAWAEGIAARFGYGVKFLPIGTEDPEVGPPTQMALFEQGA